MRRPAAVEQRQHGGVARDESTARAPRRRADRYRPCGLRGGDRQRLRQGLGDLRRAHGGERGDLAFAVAFEKAREARTPASTRISERLPMPSARRAAMKARTSCGRQLRKILERRRAAQMRGEETEKLRDVAPIGLERLRPTCAARRPDSRASARFRPRRRARERGIAAVPAVIVLRMVACVMHPFLHPSLSRLESARPFSWPNASSMSWCRSRSTRPIRIACRRRSTLAPGDIVSVPLGARDATAVVWADNPKPNPRLDNRLKDVEEKLDLPPLKRRTAQLRRLGRELHGERRAAWCCACACAWASISAPSASGSACGLPVRRRSA